MISECLWASRPLVLNHHYYTYTYTHIYILYIYSMYLHTSSCVCSIAAIVGFVYFYNCLFVHLIVSCKSFLSYSFNLYCCILCCLFLNVFQALYLSNLISQSVPLLNQPPGRLWNVWSMVGRRCQFFTQKNCYSWNALFSAFLIVENI